MRSRLCAFWAGGLGDEENWQTGKGFAWRGGKVSAITHLTTDLIVAVDVMSANAVARCNDQAKALLQGRRIRRPHGDSAYADEDHRCQMAWCDTMLSGSRRGKVRWGRVRGGGRVATTIDCGKRAHVEWVQANVVRWRGNRRAWSIGLAKGPYQSALSAYTANLARIRSLIAHFGVRLRASA